jgi:hypothetical protein
MLQHQTRRLFFQKAGFGLGGAALMSLLQNDLKGVPTSAPVNAFHHPPRAKSVIFLHMVGAPSHLDLFDYKPELQKRSGELCPDHFFKGQQLAFIRQQPNLMGTPDKPEFSFTRCGQSGLGISNLLPSIQSVADELCLIRSVHTEQFNHAPAQLFSLTGFARFGRPSIGSWVSYGIGSENSSLPSFVVLISGQVLGAGNSAWGSGFLPTVHQGVEFRSQGDPVLFLSDPDGLTRTDRRGIVSGINHLNSLNLDLVGDPEIATRISQYEMAYRMQASVPDLMDLTTEPESVHRMYGYKHGESGFAANCLLARRLVERGVRFVQLFDQGWDHHNNVFGGLKRKVRSVDQPVAALIRDLRQRGLLDQTLVVWNSEFGRTPMAQTTVGTGASISNAGRDHHKEAYTLWMAGGGIRPGIAYGETDELGYSITRNPVSVHDFNATILNQLGIDHERLTFRYQGRQFRLTDVHGTPVRGIISSARS